ncbi:hypothetical protein ACHAW6_014399 [Cyclotella cf. meneghiniana]
MACTTLPTPETDYIFGSKGNEATCSAQGFFIQIGTIACLLGSSLACYYNLTIKQGWNESKLKRKKIVYFLLIPPIITGFAFAGAAIPYYDNVLVWCNNSARWWPEVPVILAIFCTTVIMGDVVFSVYKNERSSSRYSQRGNRLSKMVLNQSIWFVAAFYVTWIPYLALQVSATSLRNFVFLQIPYQKFRVVSITVYVVLRHRLRHLWAHSCSCHFGPPSRLLELFSLL